MSREKPKTLIGMFLHKAVCWLLLAILCSTDEYVIDNSVGPGRRFDGVGAISGGGVMHC